MRNLLGWVLAILLCGLSLPSSAQQSRVVDSLEHLLVTAKDDQTKIDLMLDLSWEVDFDKSLQYCANALALAESTGYTHGQIGALFIFGWMYSRSDPVKGFDYFIRALRLAESDKDDYAIARVNEELSTLVLSRGDYQSAFSYAKKAESSYGQCGDTLGMAFASITVANIYCHLLSCDESLKKYQEALGYVKAHDARHNKDHMDAWNWKSLEESCYQGMAKAYDSQGKYDEAMTNYELALDVVTEMGEMGRVAHAYNNMGLTESHRGRLDEALMYCLKAKQIYEDSDSRKGRAQVYVDLAKILWQQAVKNPEPASAKLTEALQYAEAGLQIAEEIDLGKTIMDAHENLSAIHFAMGHVDTALKEYKSYTFHKDSIFRDWSDKGVAQLKIQYETEKKDREIELLSKDNDIKALHLREHQASLLTSQLRAKDRENRIRLLTASSDLKELQLAKTAKDLEQQQTAAKAQTAEMALLTKDSELRDQQMARQTLVRNGLIVGSLMLIVIGFIGFRSLQFRRRAEKLQVVVQERKRISADLHDDIGAGLSKIGLLSDLVMTKAKTPDVQKEAEEIAATSTELSDQISDIIWTLNVNNDHLDNLVAYIRRYAAEYFENSPIRLSITTPEYVPHAHISAVERRNIYYAVKEALHNIMKHSKASEAEIVFALHNNELSVIIRDNGVGIHGETNQFGNGIGNMRGRMEAIRGSFRIENHAGTRVTLAFFV